MRVLARMLAIGKTVASPTSTTSANRTCRGTCKSPSLGQSYQGANRGSVLSNADAAKRLRQWRMPSASTAHGEICKWWHSAHLSCLTPSKKLDQCPRHLANDQRQVAL